jgi:hypothetical protein
VQAIMPGQNLAAAPSAAPVTSIEPALTATSPALSSSPRSP